MFKCFWVKLVSNMAHVEINSDTIENSINNGIIIIQLNSYLFTCKINSPKPNEQEYRKRNKTYTNKIQNQWGLYNDNDNNDDNNNYYHYYQSINKSKIYH